MSDLVIRSALGLFTALDGPAARAQGDIRIRDGRILAIGEIPPLPGDRIIDASGCIVTPGLVNTHHHLFQSVLKGIAAGINVPLEPWLRMVPYAHWHRLDGEALAVAAELGMVELLLQGCTTLADHHYLFDAAQNYDAAQILFETAERLGLRFVLARGGSAISRSFDNDDIVPMPVESVEQMLSATEALAHRYHDPAADGMARVALAPTTPFWSLPAGSLPEVIAATRAMGLRLHSHLSETGTYVDYALASFGQRPIPYVASQGWVGEDVWYAHLVHLDADEVAILAETGTGMAHCPQSNGRLGSGIAPASALAARGGRVSLGVDGAASNEAADLVSEMHVGWMFQRAAHGAGAATCEEVLRWATAGGADVLGLAAIGTLAPGQAADIAIFDLAHPRYAGLHDPLIAPVASGGAAHLRHVLVGGRQVVQDGAIPGLDLPRLMARAAATVQRMAG
ncbi:MAG TPA: amidohydrolase family protein [Novosphingobium sp.]|nr:amidohydrolase family protein [Novosphingobium sp.]HZV08696.1 amidohydrolase family protein [Novosphingobium sp.]